MLVKDNVSVTISSGSYTSDVVQDEFFGSNFAHHRDVLDENYANKLKVLGIEVLRFPGGSETEYSFDITDPDNINNDSNFNKVALTDFLKFCNENDITPIIAIPTQRYKDNLAQGIEDVSKFIHDVTSGVYGEITIQSFEIGNEYFVKSDEADFDSLTPQEYGEISSAFAVAINNNSNYEVGISVQAGINELDNKIIMSYYDTNEEQSAINMISIHNYAFTYERTDDKAEEKASLAFAWEETLGKEVKIFMSEWNQKSQRGDDYDKDKYVYGLSSASIILENAKESIEAGIDIATIWTLNQSNKTSLSDIDSTNFTINGEMFRMMEESVTGTRVLDIDNTISGSEDFVLHAFEDESKIVLFVSARGIRGDTYDLNLDLNLENMEFSDVQSVWAEQLSTADDPEGYKSAPIVSEYVPDVTITGDNSAKINLHYTSHYDVIKIVINKDVITDIDSKFVGDNSSNFFNSGNGSDYFETHGGKDRVNSNGGDDEVHVGSGADIIRSGAGSDLVYCGKGFDLVRAGSGNDSVYGQLGNDKIYGGRGSDVIIGGANSDKLFGGAGSDILRGGLQNDKLFGGKGNDFLYGGDGHDVLTGGAGSDVFVFDAYGGNDTITDFSKGYDKILITSALASFSSLEIVNDGFGNTIVTYGEHGSITILGSEGEIDESDFEFVPVYIEDLVLWGDDFANTIAGRDGNDKLNAGGGNDLIRGRNGDDRIDGESGNDTIFGGDGADVIYGSGGKDKLYGGHGNDYLSGGWGEDQLTGGVGSDTLNGGDGNDVLTGGAGSDVFVFDAYGGNDTITDFSKGYDKILITSALASFSSLEIVNDGFGNTIVTYGEHGSITILGSEGEIDESDFEFVPVYAEDLVIFGDEFANRISGNDGNDTITAGGGDDVIHGRNGDDRIGGEDGNDIVFGGDGADVIYGNGGDDQLFGGLGDDYLRGGWGNDILWGGAGNDKLVGDNENDRLIGGAGDDFLIGGGDSDTFVFEHGDGNDVISNFSVGVDRIEFLDAGMAFEDLTITSDQNGHTYVSYGDNDQIQILNTVEPISEADFIFI